MSKRVGIFGMTLAGFLLAVDYLDYGLLKEALNTNK